MKKLVFVVLLTFVTAATFFSCQKECDIDTQTNVEIEKGQIQQSFSFERLKEISILHSSGIDACYESLNTELMSNRHIDFTKPNIKKLSVSFVGTVSKDFDYTTRSSSENQFVIEDSVSFALSATAEIILEEFLDSMYHSTSAESMEVYIKNLMLDSKYLTLDATEQPLLIFMMLIGIDSAQYWLTPGNIEKWEYLRNLHPMERTRGMAGPPASYWMSSDQIADERITKLVNADVRGSLYSLVAFTPLTWLSGAIVGSVESALN